mgnify:CR=1 FL=1
MSYSRRLHPLSLCDCSSDVGASDLGTEEDAHPKYLATGHPAGIADDAGGVFPRHNFQVVDTRVYVSVWHAGVYVFDVADPAHPRDLAMRTPAHASTFPEPGAQVTAGSVNIFVDMDGVWDVLVVNGYTLLTDLPAGIEVLSIAGDPFGEPTYSSYG